MVKEGIKFVILWVIFTVILILVHEEIHSKIYSYDGCKDVKISISSSECVDYDYKWSKESRSMHMLNEILGYNFMILITLMLVLGYSCVGNN